MISRKSPMAWRDVCKNRKQGGLSIVNLEVWSMVAMIILLWNLSQKSDSMWIKWIHVYYLTKIV